MADLSPAAQAVLDAYRDADIDDEATAAAVLRAASWQLTNAKAIDTLRSIADELES